MAKWRGLQNQRFGSEGDFEVAPCLVGGLKICGKFPQNEPELARASVNREEYPQLRAINDLAMKNTSHCG